MGQRTQATIAAWQQEHGINEATGARRKALNDLSSLAFELIKIVELEKSGIRDGDGYWHGGDPLGIVRDISEAYRRLQPGNELCDRCGAHMQLTHAPWCAARDGTPVPAVLMTVDGSISPTGGPF